jgi:hypothetical protein
MSNTISSNSSSPITRDSGGLQKSKSPNNLVTVSSSESQDNTSSSPSDSFFSQGFKALNKFSKNVPFNQVARFTPDNKLEVSIAVSKIIAAYLASPNKGATTLVQGLTDILAQAKVSNSIFSTTTAQPNGASSTPGPEVNYANGEMGEWLQQTVGGNFNFARSQYTAILESVRALLSTPIEIVNQLKKSGINSIEVEGRGSVPIGSAAQEFQKAANADPLIISALSIADSRIKAEDENIQNKLERGKSQNATVKKITAKPPKGNGQQSAENAP